MKDTLFNLSKRIFDKTISSSTTNIDFNISDKIEYAKIEFGKKIQVIIPKPIVLDKRYYFEGNVFDDYNKYQNTIWSLYLATIYHVGAHIQVSNYTNYEGWLKDKTTEKGWNIINFIEDIKVEEYLKKFHTDVWQNMAIIKIPYDKYFDSQIHKYSREKFSRYFGVDDSKESWRLKLKEILKNSDQDVNKIIPYLNFLYKNQHLLPKKNYPYCDRQNYKRYSNTIPNITIHPKGEFERFTQELDEYWLNETPLESKRIEQYRKYAENSNFDRVEVSPENFGEFLRINNESASDLRRLRTTLRTISFFVDSPAYEEFGIIDMPPAIQRIASQAEEIEIFEQDIPRKESENWVVIFDVSSSMKLKFEEMKKFIICLAETAERINQDGGKWGLYSFNNKFLVVKDHKERYNQNVKARIGGIKSEGLSFISDAIDVGTKILNHDNKSAHKYLIVVSDGKSSGYETSDKKTLKALEHARKNNIILIGVGIPSDLKKPFAFTIDYDNMKKSVKKFIDSYTNLVQTQG